MQPTLLTLHDPAAARNFYSAGEWRSDTMYGLAAAHALARPQGFAVQDRTRRLSWRGLVDWADAMANDLVSAGLGVGDRVGVWLPNRVEVIVTFLACSRAGLVCVPSLHKNHSVGEVLKLLEACGAAALVAQPGYGADSDRHDIFALTAGLPRMRQLYAVSTEGGQETSGVRAFSSAAASGPALPPVENPDKIAYIAFTSGTTGLPKAVMHSDNSLLANGRALVRDWHLGPDTIIYTLSPMSHHIGTVALEQALVAGCEMVLNDLPPDRTALDHILATGATYVMGVPTHAIDLLGEMDRRGLDRMGAVETFYLSGAAIPGTLARRLAALGLKPQSVYGMTECGSSQYTRPNDALEIPVRSCGRVCSAYGVKLWGMDDRDIEVEPGAIGEIGGRGAQLMLGYFGNQPATEAAFNAQGWFMSGDLGRLDENGNLEVVGRIKDVIIRGGHNIFPLEIENLVLRHPGVSKAAAFPIGDERLGERVCLAVIADGTHAVEAEDLLDHLARTGLSKYDMPEYFIAMDEFPLTASGKVLKREMVELVQSGAIHPLPIRYNARATAE